MVQLFNDGRNAKLKAIVLDNPGSSYKPVAAYLASNKAWAKGLYEAIRKAGLGFIPKNKMVWAIIDEAEGSSGGGDTFE